MQDIFEERKRLYEQSRVDLLKRQLSNSENLDKSVLSLSTAGLGFSLAFIKDVVPISKSSYSLLLYVSWWCFAVAIVSTLVSFIVSNCAVKRQLTYAEKYYLRYQDEFLAKVNPWAELTDYLNLLSAGIFILAIISTLVFVSLNLDGGKEMSSKKPTAPIAEKGATIPAMQPHQGRFDHGQPIPSLQPVTSPQGSGKQGNSQSQGGKADAGNQGTASDKK